MSRKVLHKHLYRYWGSTTINTTICGRVRNGGDYNVADTDEDVTCKYCLGIMAPRRLKEKKK